MNLVNYSSYTNSSYRYGDLLVLSASVALSKATNWSSENALVLTVSEDARPPADRSMQFSAAFCVEGGGVFFRTATLGTNGQVRVGTSGVDSVVAIRFIGIPVRL